MMKKKVNDKKRVTKKINLQTEVETILKTILLLDKPYSINYLVNILTGSTNFKWRRAGHTELVTFGGLSKHSPVRLYRILQLMIDKALIEGVAHNYVNIRVTPEGMDYLENPRPIQVTAKKLKYTRHEVNLFHLLKQTRSTFSEQEGRSETQVLPQFILERIAYIRPEDKEALASIPGMGKVRLEKLGPSILEILNQIRKEEVEAYERRKQMALKSHTFKQTKELWEKGYSLEEISKIKGITESSVVNYLERLHYAGEINLRPWIEKNVDSKDLFMGVEFFKQVKEPKLKQAYEATGLDYSVLRFCRMYVSSHKQTSVQLSLVA